MNTVLTLSKEIELVLIRSLSPKTLLLLGPVYWLIQTPSIMGIVYSVVFLVPYC